ncbi:pseudouridine synthase [Burkholderia multivorans]|uniref:pseudouridine synthase n=1 Tax=Burkholderia multivorans TaxID=87883 RepID=UPI000CFF7F95|nr:pseudouridine synthase [Burkholderia multivorans]MBR8239475.1 pseudouridine synthase [Burkholderia multivorans]MDR9173405.1 23S rRNA pseudouridine(2604) synthase [Burkholderia multivorans]MDR9183628.1 23S rRNA pseudouridine(2604) synthase [Burkholderia multivorans]MDR9189310.1 23S rRNA pseudouridine(2604) synthase [Burkholderia multivorans]MDR9190972.1 23S rRNA pseudouridine(2604) synthase [Burkholderia multivorans]
MRTKLTVKNPRPASPSRAPVRSGSLVARKPVRAAAPAAAAKPARPKPAARTPAAGPRPAKPRAAASANAPRPDRDTAGEGAKRSSFGERRASSERPARRNDDEARPRRTGAAEGGKRASYRDGGAGGEGAKRGSFGERRASSERPARRNDDDARPRRAGAAESGKRAPYRDGAAGGEGPKRGSFGERRASSDRPARRNDDDARPRRAGAAEGGKRAPYRDGAAGGEGAKRGSFGERRTSSDRPARRNDDDARPRRASATEGGKRAPYRDTATAGEGAKRGSFGERRASSDRPARRNDDDARPRRTSAAEGGKRAPYRDAAAGEGAKRGSTAERRPSGNARLKTAEPVKRRAADIDRGDEAGLMRLSKRMSELGLCSRREADEWIEKGWVLVDGERIDTLGTKVRADQRIEIDERAQAAQAAQVTILLHKPVGYVSGQAEDGYEPASVLITRENHWSGDRSPLRFSPQHLRALAPAGRLDIDSTGLLVLTQNGRIAKQLIGEQSDVDKEYLVRVRFGDRLTDIDQHFPAERLAQLRHGLELDGVALKPAMVSWQNGEQLRFVLREGRKRQIRRMCELVGLEVIGLKRVRMGRVTLGALPQGQWRYLSADEQF